MLGSNLTPVLYMSDERSTDYFLSQLLLYCACPTDKLDCSRRDNIIYVRFNVLDVIILFMSNLTLFV
jgi:hypothetical protein